MRSASSSAADAKKREQGPELGGSVLVTGGAGFVGRHLVRQLAERDETVICLYHARLPETVPNVYPVCSDMATSELLAAPLRGVDTVIHLAWDRTLLGPDQKTPSHKESHASAVSNLHMLENLMTAMERAGTRRLIFLSAIGACRHTTQPFLREKYIAEHIILNSKLPEKIIVRSSLVYGAGSGDRLMRSMLRVMKFPLVYPVPRTKSPMAPLHVEDLVGLLEKVSRHKMRENFGLIELAGEEKYQLGDLLKLVSEQCVKGMRLPVGGYLGERLMPYFERDSKADIAVPRLQHLMALGGRADDAVEKENPLAALLPVRMTSFRETLALAQAN